MAHVRREPHQCALVQVAHHARVRAVRDDRRRPAAADRAHLLAQRVVGAPRAAPLVEVAAGPGLDAGVDVERVDLVAQRDQRGRRHVDRQVDQEPAGDDRREDVAEVVGRSAVFTKRTPSSSPSRRTVVGVDHDHALPSAWMWRGSAAANPCRWIRSPRSRSARESGSDLERRALGGPGGPVCRENFLTVLGCGQLAAGGAYRSLRPCGQARSPGDAESGGKDTRCRKISIVRTKMKLKTQRAQASGQRRKGRRSAEMETPRH